MPTLSSPSDRYSAISSSSSSSSSRHHHPKSNSLSQSSTFLPLHATTSSFHLSQLPPSTDYRSMLSLKSPSALRVPPRVVQPPLSTLSKRQLAESNAKDEHWLSCDELENIEKRFTDLLQGNSERKQNEYQHYDQRAKSCDRLALDERDYHKTAMSTLTGLQFDQCQEEISVDSIDFSHLVAHPMVDRRSRSPSTNNNKDNYRTNRSQSRSRSILSADDILKVESSYRSIGTQVFVARSLCDLYITTADRLAKLEDWIHFQHGLPVWLLNSGANPQRPSRLSLLMAEQGSGFPLWEDMINRSSEVKQARSQHLTFRLSDQVTLAVLRFHDQNASKDFFASYLAIRNDPRYQQMFAKKSSRHGRHHRSSSVGSFLSRHRKSTKNSLNKSSISNPCQFQHITSLQLHDRLHLTSLEHCLMTSMNFSDEL